MKEATAFFRLLGDEARLRILRLLEKERLNVSELTSILGIAQPGVSRHLRLLKDAGLVVEEPRGTRRLYRLHDEGLAAVRAYLDRVWGDAATRFRLVAENSSARAAGSTAKGSSSRARRR